MDCADEIKVKRLNLYKIWDYLYVSEALEIIRHSKTALKIILFSYKFYFSPAYGRFHSVKKNVSTVHRWPCLMP